MYDPMNEQAPYRAEATGETGFNSGRPRYRVTCNKCGAVVHENTTGPAAVYQNHQCEPTTGCPQCNRCGYAAQDWLVEWKTWFCKVCDLQTQARDFKTERDEARAELTAERDRMRERLLTAAGDDLCRLTQEEIKAYTSGKVPIPPKSEFLASCERFHAQVAGEAGVNNNCLTLAQLVAEVERLLEEKELLLTGLRQIQRGSSVSGPLRIANDLLHKFDAHEPEDE